MTKYSPDRNAGGKLTAKKNVRRVVEKLAELSLVQAPSDAGDCRQTADQLKDFEELIDLLVQAHRKRGNHFPKELVCGPAWDIMVELLQARTEGRQASVSSVCFASALPATTAERWIDALAESGLVIRRADRDGAQRGALALTPAAYTAFRAYFLDLCGRS